MKSKGVEFSELFDPDVMGNGPIAEGYMSNGVPLRFAHIQYGAKRADVGYARNGVDVSNLWAAKGTATYLGPKAPGFAPAYQNSRGGIHDVAADLTLRIRADGTWGVTKTTAGSIQGSPLSGTWHNAPAAGVGAACEMRWNDSSPWISLASDQSQTVSAFSSTGTGGGGNEFDSRSFQISIRNTNGTMLIRALTSITAEAST